MDETPKQRQRFNELAEEVVAAQGVLTVWAEQPKKAWDAQRLGANIRGYITEALERRDIGHIPVEFPDRESALVRLYVRNSAVGRIIEAVLNPGEDTDDEIRNLVEGVALDNKEVQLTQIRQLVGALQDVLDES